MYFTFLPDELLGLIFANVDPLTFFFVVSLVCKRFRAQETNNTLLLEYCKILKCQDTERVKYKAVLLQMVKQIVRGKSALGELFNKIFNHGNGNYRSAINSHYKQKNHLLRAYCDSLFLCLPKREFCYLSELAEMKCHKITSLGIMRNLMDLWRAITESLGCFEERFFYFCSLRKTPIITPVYLEIRKAYPFILERGASIFSDKYQTAESELAAISHTHIGFQKNRARKIILQKILYQEM